MFSETLTQGLAIMDVVNLTNNNNTNTNSSGIDCSKVKRILYVIQNVGLGSAGTIDGRLQASANSNFNVLTNLSGTNLTQITTNNVIATIEVRADQVTSQSAGARYVRLQLTGGGNALNFVAIGYGAQSEQAPAGPNYDVNSSFIAQRLVCNT